MKVDVIVPVYRPDRRFLEQLRRLEAQTQPVNRYIIMNTEQEYWDRWTAEIGADALPENLSVFHVTKETFDHGATRNAGMERSDADVCVCMTDDALPADRRLLEKLTEALYPKEFPAGAAGIAIAYARQLPDRDCGVIERYTRSFNYPAESRVKTKADLSELGIKTYFCSNVCAAYRREIYLKLGGFIRKTIFNEDMIFAAKAMEAGYAVSYAADARVIHSHNYTAMEQFHRNFDLAVSQADHPEVFAGIRSEGEGLRLVKKTAGFLLRTGHAALIPVLVWNSGWKYLGYLLGKRYRSMPLWLVRRLSMNRNYWPEESARLRGQNTF